MAYGNWGATVYENGKRRRDKEDVGVYEIAGDGPGTCDDLHHGVMGDGPVRVGCYKSYFPSFYILPDGCDAPIIVKVENIIKANGWEGEPFVESFRGESYIGDTYDLDGFTVPGCDGYTFSAIGDDLETTSWVRMVEPDGTVWECRYGYCYGAGFEDGGW